MKSGVLLVAEDDPDDQVLMQDALERLPVDIDLRFVKDGYELMSYLNTSRDRNRHPKLILLDLNMPGMDGRAVLKEIHSDSRLAQIPVVVLTTSNAEDDIKNCRKLGARDCYQKPTSLTALARILDKVVSDFM